MSETVTLEAFSQEWLRDIQQGNPSTTELGHRFARKLLTQWLDTDDSSNDIVYCDGAGDGGIDIAYLYRNVSGNEDTVGGDTWYLLQSKYGSAFQGVNTLLQEGRKVIDTLDGQRRRLSSLAEGVLERLFNFLNQASDRDRIVLVFGTNEPLNAEQKRTLADVRAVGRERLGAIFDVEEVSIATIYRRTLEEQAVNSHIRVSIQAELVRSGEDLLIGSVNLLSLYEFLKKYREQTDDLDQLYEKNVRRFLGSRGRVNKGMRETLNIEPDRFGLYNNGITIVVTDFQEVDTDNVSGNKGYLLVDPYIVNGCQTTRTIWDVCYQRLEAGGTGISPASQDWQRRAGQGVVLAKIVKVGVHPNGLLQSITRYTNTQNGVREKDFLALRSDLRIWADQMAQRYNVFLEIQRGSWDSRRAWQNQNPSSPAFHEFANAFDLIKVYGAGWLSEAGTAFGANEPFLPNGPIFSKIVANPNEGEPFGVEDLYVCYRLLKETTDTYQFGRGSDRNSRKQTRFLFFMMVIELLKGIINREGMSPTSTDLKAFTVALSKLFQPESADALRVLLDLSAQAIDKYLEQSSDEDANTIFREPTFLNSFNSDLNGYLKWEKLGKREEDSPRFRSLINFYRVFMGMSFGGQPAPRDLIKASIRS